MEHSLLLVKSQTFAVLHYCMSGSVVMYDFYGTMCNKQIEDALCLYSTVYVMCSVTTMYELTANTRGKVCMLRTMHNFSTQIIEVASLVPVACLYP